MRRFLQVLVAIVLILVGLNLMGLDLSAFFGMAFEGGFRRVAYQGYQPYQVGYGYRPHCGVHPGLLLLGIGALVAGLVFSIGRNHHESD